MKKESGGHAHGWVAGTVCTVAGVVLITVFPRMKGISSAILLAGLFHVVGAVIVLGSAASFAPPSVRNFLHRLVSRPGPATAGQLDFGWSGGWMNILWLTGLALGGAALGLQIRYPGLWPLWFLVALAAVNAFIGNGVLQTCRRADCVVLPMVDLLSSDHDHVLDAGSGAGRTIIWLSRVLKNGKITAFDRFTADYIEGGGLELLKRNLAVAGISDRVQIEKGDITHMPFQGTSFDSVVSTNVIDHLGAGKQRGLSEVCRVLKPGGRFLMVIWVPGWATFAMANIFSFHLTSKREWRAVAQTAGFQIADQGHFNGMWYLLLRKPV
jgi:SAM-dependent methyltransferase